MTWIMYLVFRELCMCTLDVCLEVGEEGAVPMKVDVVDVALLDGVKSQYGKRLKGEDTPVLHMLREIGRPSRDLVQGVC